MPSSFIDSVPPIVKAIIEVNPKKVVDVGPGWGKYGLMCREYLHDVEQVDAVEVGEGRKSIQDCIYDQVIERDVRTCPEEFWSGYDLVLIIDVIEHMTLEDGQVLLGQILRQGASVLVSTPKIFTEQHDDHNPFEAHVSHWLWNDFWYHTWPETEKADVSTIDSTIIVISPKD